MLVLFWDDSACRMFCIKLANIWVWNHLVVWSSEQKKERIASSLGECCQFLSYSTMLKCGYSGWLQYWLEMSRIKLNHAFLAFRIFACDFTNNISIYSCLHIAYFSVYMRKGIGNAIFSKARHCPLLDTA